MSEDQLKKLLDFSTVVAIGAAILSIIVSEIQRSRRNALNSGEIRMLENQMAVRSPTNWPGYVDLHDTNQVKWVTNRPPVGPVSVEYSGTNDWVQIERDTNLLYAVFYNLIEHRISSSHIFYERLDYTYSNIFAIFSHRPVVTRTNENGLFEVRFERP